MACVLARAALCAASALPAQAQIRPDPPYSLCAPVNPGAPSHLRGDELRRWLAESHRYSDCGSEKRVRPATPEPRPDDPRPASEPPGGADPGAAARALALALAEQVECARRPPGQAPLGVTPDERRAWIEEMGHLRAGCGALPAPQPPNPPSPEQHPIQGRADVVAEVDALMRRTACIRRSPERPPADATPDERFEYMEASRRHRAECDARNIPDVPTSPAGASIPQVVPR